MAQETPAKAPAAPAAPVPQAAPSPATAAPPAPTEPTPALEPPVPPKSAQGLQALVLVLALATFGVLILLPLSYAGVIALGPDDAAVRARQIQILILASLLLYGAFAAFLPSEGRKKGRAHVGARMMHKTKREIVLNGLSVLTTFVLILMGAVEVASLLVFLGVYSATSAASVAVASNYILFATFTLLFLDMLIIARTSYSTRQPISAVHRMLAFIAIGLSGVSLLLALLVSLGVLNAGIFAGVQPHQAIYIATLGVFFQLWAFKLLLRYPRIMAMALGAVQAARKAGKDMRDEITKRAFRTYMIGLGFVLVSIFFVGGLATQRITIKEERTGNLLLIIYVVMALTILGVLVTRYLQHRYIDAKERRRERGELIAKKRYSRQQVIRILVFSFSGLFGTLFLVVGLLTLADLSPIQPRLGTDLLILAFLAGVGPYGFFRGFELRRRRAMDDKFPDLLRDLAESQRAGMTLPRALTTAAKGTYGALTPEIRKMSAQVEWGVSFTEALGRFARRVGTPLIERAVVLITEAANAGGNVVDILTAASDDAREIKQILEERKRQMAIYAMIIYIAFFVYMVVIFVLAAQFLPGFEKAVGAASGQKVGGLNFEAFDKQTFITVFFHGALIQAVGGGLVSGVMTGGHPLDGLKHSFIMTIISWVFFRLFL